MLIVINLIIAYLFALLYRILSPLYEFNQIFILLLIVHIIWTQNLLL